MALPILDGNQTAATLSTIITGGAHIPAHTVVSLGSQAISDISNAVSSLQVSGTVTANINSIPNVLLTGSNGDPINDGGSIPVFLTQAGEISGTVTAKIDGIDPTIVGNGGSIIQPIPGPDVNSVRAVIWSVDSSGDIGAEVGPANPLPISGTVTANVGGIASGVTLPVRLFAEAEGGPSSGQDTLVACDSAGQLLINAKSSGSSVIGYDGNAFVSVKQVSGSSITVGSLPNIFGTVTVGNSITIGSFSTSVTARLVDGSGTAVSYAATGSAGTPSTDVVSVQGVSGGTSLPISGTAGTLTTRFGSITTAGTAQISSAVTNASRKYLLIQNVTTSSNVITVGIGFTPTTTQGIQLSAGAGITFESSYIPTGAVYILSGVTASPFTILEA